MAAKIRTEKPWAEWKDAIWNQMADRFGHPGLAPLEQYMIRSEREKRCVDCGEPGTISKASVIIPRVKTYWMCDDCNAYWEAKR